MPIDQSIISLNTETIQKSIVKTSIRSWIEQEIELLLEEYPDKTIILLLDSVFRYNQKWAELRNENVSLYELPFQSDLLKYNNRIKVIRINTTEEVPYYDITDDKKEFTKKSGLFRHEKGVYYSIGIRPESLQSKNDAVKVDIPHQLIGKQKNVELIISGGHSQEERDRLALMCHNLRRANLTYDASTKLPLPMHCLETLKDYIEIFLKLT